MCASIHAKAHVCTCPLCSHTPQTFHSFLRPAAAGDLPSLAVHTHMPTIMARAVSTVPAFLLAARPSPQSSPLNRHPLSQSCINCCTHFVQVFQYAKSRAQTPTGSTSCLCRPQARVRISLVISAPSVEAMPVVGFPCR